MSAAELDSQISDADPEDPSLFCIELRGFLQELGCGYTSLLNSNGMDSAENRLRLLEYLSTELQACRINAVNGTGPDVQGMEVEVGRNADAGNPAQLTETIVHTLGLSPAERTSAEVLVAAVAQRVQQAKDRAGPDYIAPPLLSKPLSATQSVKLAEICSMFNQDYTLRKQMLLQRLDVTIQ